MDTAVKVPLSERFNFRIIIFAIIMLVLVGYPIYTFLSEQITGGIHHNAAGYIETNLKAMGNFAFDERTGTIDDVPRQWRELDGKKLSLVGELYSSTQSAEMDRFELVYSIAQCCFNGPPRVQERVFCTMPAGKPVAYYGGFYRVQGTLHVKVTKNDLGVTTSVFTMDVETAVPEQ